MKTYPFRIVGCLLALAPFSHAELTPVQRVEYTGGGDGTSTDFMSESVSLTYEEALTGFTKFDPTLGTLTRVIVTAEVSATYSADLYSFSVSNPFGSFSLYYEESLNDSLQVSVAYKPTGETFALALTFDTQGPGSLGEEFLDPADYGGSDGFYYSDFVSFDFGGFADGGDLASEGEFLASHEDFNASDFIGTGNVTGLAIG